MRFAILPLALFGLLSYPLRSQEADAAKLTLERIYNSGDFRGEPVRSVRWLDGGAYTSWESAVHPRTGSDLVRYDSAGKKELLIAAEKLVPPGAKEPLPIQGYELSKDLDLVLIYTNSVKVWRQNTRGDYWTFRRSTGKLAKLGGNAKPASLMFAKLSPDASKVAYVRGNNLYAESSAGGAIAALTADGSDEVINGTFDWVYEEEFDCRDGFRWSPDGGAIAYWQVDTRGVKRFTMIDNTSEKYPKLTSFAYPKAGERNSVARVGVVPVSGGPTRFMDVPGDMANDYYIPRMEWAGNARELVIRRVNRRQNAIDVMLAETASGRVRSVYTDRDGAWVDVHDDAVEWLDGGKSFTWISEQDGWRHLYAVSRDGLNVRKITPEDYDVIRVVHIDEKANAVYFLASPANATQHYLYSVPLDGKGPAKRLTPTGDAGTHDYQISPEGHFAVHTFSNINTPPRVEIVSLPDHKVIQTLATNEKLRQALAKLGRAPVEFIHPSAGSGSIKLDGWLMKPPAFDPKKKYPLLFHVYGEPASQLVTDHWGGDNFLFHWMLAQRGYLIASVDNRGTPCPRGREWRKASFRKIGTLASEDQAAAARDLLKLPFVDPARVGIWGWSGGGSMTLNMLFRYPEIYKAGIAIAPVPDIRLYDTIYEERYMGLPQENPEDYKMGSPIAHAAGLKGKLLLVHGTGDDNVHYQGTERLIDELVARNKSFRLMSYPNRTHSINEGANTTRHLRELMADYLNENLPPGGR